MDRYTNFELADMHLMYGAAQGNARHAVRLYREQFPNRDVPGPRFFSNLHMRLRETGSLRSDRRMNAGRPANRLFANEELIVENFERNPRNSTRQASRRLGINHMAVWRILRQNNFHPFHFQRVQGLLEADFAPRLQFSRWVLRAEEAEEYFAKRILFTDEAFFCRDGIFNIHNSHHWQVNNPHVIYPHSHQHRFSVNVWAGIVADNLIGPYLMPSPLTGESYKIFLQDVLPGLLENVPLNFRRRMWFQHDGAPAHYYRGARQVLEDKFPNRWIGRGGPVAWPARSPDMSPLDFFLWGAMKNMIYETPVESPIELVGRIVTAAEEIAEIPTVFQSVRQSFHERCVKCIEVNGGHFEQLL